MAPRKRLHDEIIESQDDDERNAKEQKTDRAAQAAIESNSDSSYVSAAAAIFSDSEDESETGHSDPESDSELSTSSEEPSSESESEEDEDSDHEGSVRSETMSVDEERTNVRPGGKPNMSKHGNGGIDLRRRLQKFMPKMEEADRQLEDERKAGILGKRNMEDFEDGQHIEMNLGLGVLEERKPGQESESEGSEDSADSEREPDIMGRLMGNPNTARKRARIDEVQAG